jgi:GTPase SAR1 family protein
MFTQEIDKLELIKRSEALLRLLNEKLPSAFFRSRLEDFLTDLKQEEQIVTVLGEFKRGKSTLINALIKKQVLPSDVTPTTATINVIEHNIREAMTIFMENGDRFEHQNILETLKNYTYESGEDLLSVHHIGIQLDLSHLDEKIVLVDTPGVGDLNEHRLDVTYSYIPRSHVVIFVFDASTPIRKSELDYLKDSVLNSHFGEIIFVANFIDRLDDEELEETLEYMAARLKKVLNGEPLNLFPISSRQALEDPHNTEFEALLTHIKKQLNDGKGEQVKLTFYQNRFEQLYKLFEEEIKSVEKLREASEEELEAAFSRLEIFKNDQQVNKQNLTHYFEERQTEIIELTFKSIQHFENELIEEIRESIHLFDGPKFQSFIEKNIPILIKRRLKNWVDGYTPYIDSLINKLEKEAISGLNRLFDQTVGPLRTRESLNRLDNKGYSVNTRSESSDTSVKSGLIAAGAGAIMVLLSGGLLMPLISMAGLPFLNRFLGQKKLDELKQEVMPHVEQEINQLITKLQNATKQYIFDEISYLEKKALDRFDEIVRSTERKLETEAIRRKTEHVSDFPTIASKDLALISE